MAPAGPATRKRDSESLVSVREPRTFHGALQDAKLLAQREILQGELMAGPKAGEKGTEHSANNVQHGSRSLSELRENLNDFAQD